MRNRPVLLVAFLFAAISWLSAQPAAHSNPSQNDPGPAITRGCLRGGLDSFTLTSKSGTTYELVGDTSQLSKLSGDEVSITGRKGSASDVSTGLSGYTGLATSNPTEGSAPMIRVTQVQKISDTCVK
jgi:hypothetical protein